MSDQTAADWAETSALLHVKSKFDQDIRRFPLDPRSLADLKDFYWIVRKTHNIKDDDAYLVDGSGKVFNAFDLFYRDPDGNLVLLESDSDLKEAAKIAKPCLNITIVPKKIKGAKRRSAGSIRATDRVSISAPSQFRVTSGASATVTSMREIELDKAADGTVGFYVRIGNEERERDAGLFVSRIVPGTPADFSGVIQSGDEILAVNGVNVTQLEIDRVGELMRSADVLRLTIQREAPLFAALSPNAKPVDNSLAGRESETEGWQTVPGITSPGINGSSPTVNLVEAAEKLRKRQSTSTEDVGFSPTAVRTGSISHHSRLVSSTLVSSTASATASTSVAAPKRAAPAPPGQQEAAAPAVRHPSVTPSEAESGSSKRSSVSSSTSSMGVAKPQIVISVSDHDDDVSVGSHSVHSRESFGKKVSDDYGSKTNMYLSVREDDEDDEDEDEDEGGDNEENGDDEQDAQSQRSAGSVGSASESTGRAAALAKEAEDRARREEQEAILRAEIEAHKAAELERQRKRLEEQKRKDDEIQKQLESLEQNFGNDDDEEEDVNDDLDRLKQKQEELELKKSEYRRQSTSNSAPDTTGHTTPTKNSAPPTAAAASAAVAAAAVAPSPAAAAAATATATATATPQTQTPKTPTVPQSVPTIITTPASRPVSTMSMTEKRASAVVAATPEVKEKFDFLLNW